MSRNVLRPSGVFLDPPCSSSRQKEWRIVKAEKSNTDKNMDEIK
jgi:hypothetical protein